MKENSQNLQFYFSVTTMPLGIVLNMITLLIFNRDKLNKKTNIGFLYSLLCLYNMIALLNQLIFNIIEYYHINLIDESDLTCKILSVWSTVIIQLPSFQLVLISIDLYTSISYSQKVNFFKKKCLILINVIILFALLFINSIQLL